MKKILVASDGEVRISATAYDYAAEKGVVIDRTRLASEMKAAVIDNDVLCFIVCRELREFRTLRDSVSNKKAFLYFRDDPDIHQFEECVRIFNDVFVKEITCYDMAKILHKPCSTSFRSEAAARFLQIGGFKLAIGDQDLLTPKGTRVKLTPREFDFLRFHFDRFLKNEVLPETIVSIREMERKDALVYNLKKKITGLTFVPSADKTYTMQFNE